MSESAGFVTIKDLTGATIATEDDDLIIQQGEETKRINLKTLGDLLVFLDKIEQVKTSTENGGINEIKATLSDGSTATFTTQNGHGIQKIEQTVKSDVSSGTNVITATLSDGQTCDFKIKNGDQGEKGDTGAALIDVVQKETSAVSGGKNVISFKLNDGSYKDVEVYNGAKGETGEVSQEVLNQTVNEAIAGVVANAPEDFDTLKEMSDWISEHEDDATAMNSAILGKANKDLSNVTGVLAIKNGGTGATTDKEAQFNLLKNMNETSDSVNDDTSIVLAYSNPATTLGAVTKRKLSYLWDYIQSKNFFEKSFSGSHGRYVKIGTIPISNGVVGYANLVLGLFSSSKIANFPVGFVNINISSGAYATGFNINGFSSIPLNSTNEITPRIIVNKTDKDYELYVDCLYSYLRVVVYENITNKFTRGNFETYDSLSGTEIFNSTTSDKIVYLDRTATYSTTPQKIGTWIDGKDVYRVVIENELEGNFLDQLAGSVESGATIISAKGQITNGMGETSFLPCYHPSYNIGLRIAANSIYFTGWSNVSFIKVMLIVEYTK